MSQPSLFTAPTSGAVLSDCRRYRYDLWRSFNGGQPARYANFVMLNPSRADASQDDPTITRCINYARDWGLDGLVVTNCYAWRSTDPRGLKTAADPIGPDNDNWIERRASEAAVVVCAWGAGAGGRGPFVAGLIRAVGKQPHYLRLTKDGHPGHPLYLPASLTPQPWD